MRTALEIIGHRRNCRARAIGDKLHGRIGLKRQSGRDHSECAERSALRDRGRARRGSGERHLDHFQPAGALSAAILLLVGRQVDQFEADDLAAARAPGRQPARRAWGGCSKSSRRHR